MYGAWKIGVNCLPLSDKLPAPELAEMLHGVGDPTVIVARPSEALDEALRDRFTTVLDASELQRVVDDGDRSPLPDVIAPRAILFGSGGSTGRPKIVNSYGAGAKVPGRTLPVGQQLGQRPGQRVLVTSPTYHTMGFSSTYLSLFEDRRPIAMERFEAGLALELIDSCRSSTCSPCPRCCGAYPPSGHRPAGPQLDRTILHPPHRARPGSSWRGSTHRRGEGHRVLLGLRAARVRDLDGDEWLAHRGSVGKPVNSELRIQDDDGREVPPGEVGKSS